MCVWERERVAGADYCHITVNTSHHILLASHQAVGVSASDIADISPASLLPGFGEKVLYYTILYISFII